MGYTLDCAHALEKRVICQSFGDAALKHMSPTITPTRWLRRLKSALHIAAIRFIPFGMIFPRESFATLTSINIDFSQHFIFFGRSIKKVPPLL